MQKWMIRPNFIDLAAPDRNERHSRHAHDLPDAGRRIITAAENGVYFAGAQGPNRLLERHLSGVHIGHR